MQVADALLHVGDRRPRRRPPTKRAGVADLAAGFGIERRLVGDDPAGLARLERGDLLAVDHDRRRPGPRRARCRSPGTRWRRPSGAGRTRSPGRPPRPSRPSAARALRAARPSPCRSPSVSTAMPRRAQDVLGQVEREAEGVVELEGDVALERAAGAEPLGLVLEQPQAAAERLLEAAFLELQRLGDQRLRAHQLGIGVAHLAAPAPAPACTISGSLRAEHDGRGAWRGA